MAQEEPPYTGVVRLRHPQTGALLEEGWRAEGLRQGPWRWHHPDGAMACAGEFLDDQLHGPIRWYSPDGRLTAEGSYAHGQRVGAWCWWFADGALQEEAHYAEDRLDGPYRTLTPEGLPRSEGRYARGRREGRWRLHDAEGHLLEDASYTRGRRHGEVRQRQPDGALVSSLWEEGAPALPRKRWEALALRMRRESSARRKLDALTEAVGPGARVAALWAMQRWGLVQLGELPELWPELGERFAESLPEEVAAWLGRLRTLEPHAVPARGLHPCWPVALDRLVMPLYAEDPQPFDRAWAGWAAPVRVGFALVLRRFGRAVPPELRAAHAPGLAEVHVHRGGLHPRQLDVVAGRVVEQDIGPAEAPPGPGLELWRGRLCPGEDWGRACLDAALSGQGLLRPTALWDAFALASPSELGELLGRIQWSAPYALALHERLWEAVQAPPEALLAQAHAVRPRSEVAADLLCTLALRRWGARGEVPPEGAEEGFAFAAWDLHARALEPVAGLEPTLRAVSALGLERGQSLLRAVLCQEWGWERALPALAVAGDEELYALALERTQNAPAESPAEAQAVAVGFGALGVEALPWLAEAFAVIRDAADPAMADALARAALRILGAQAQAGQLPDAAWDGLLSFHGLADRSLSDHSFRALVEPALAAVLAVLPPARLRAVVRAGMDPHALNPARILLAAVARPEPELLALVFDGLGELAPALSPGSLAWVEARTRQLGAAALPHAARAVVLSEHEPLREALAAALGEEALGQALAELGVQKRLRSPAEVVERIAAALRQPGAPTERVYALTRRVGQAPQPGSLDRVGGVPAGVDEARWPRSGGLPMACALTLDLAGLPELAARHPGAAALAVFVRADRGPGPPAEVLVLDEAEARACRVPDEHAEALGVEAVELPVAVWEAEEGLLCALRRALGLLSGRVLGRPTGPGAPARTDLLVQLDRSLLPVNPEDRGVLYIWEPQPEEA